MKHLVLFIFLFSALTITAQKKASVSFEKWISLKNIGGTTISADGRTIVYSVSSTDWTNNSYDSELWMSHNGDIPFQLTRTLKNSSTAPRFTPDSKFVSFLADRGEKTQLYIIAVSGGEAMQVTKDEDGIANYEWNNDGNRIAYTKTEPESKKDKTVRDRFGAFGVEGEEYKQSHLWLLNYNYDSIVLAGQVPCYTSKVDSTKKDSVIKIKGQECFGLPVAIRLTNGEFTVGGFAWNPDGKTIAFNRQRNPLINSGLTSDIVLIDLATKKMKTLVSNLTGDFFSRWNPEGNSFVYSSSLNDSTTNFYKNSRMFIYDINTKSSREIATDIDENKFVADWNKDGLFVSALEKTKQKLFSVDIKTGKTKSVNIPLDLVPIYLLVKTLIT